MQNGKFYPVDIESGEVDLDSGEYMMKEILEQHFILVDANDRFRVYKKRKTIKNIIAEFFQPITH